MSTLFQSDGKVRFTQTEKEANDFKWYREQADLLDNRSFMGRPSSLLNMDNGFSGRSSSKINYDLFNNILNEADLMYVTRPFGDDSGEMPAKMVNRDIVSGKIKAVLGMEMSMPFSWGVIATNREATNRKSEAEFGKIRQYVIDTIMMPIKMQAEHQAMEQFQGKPLTKEQQRQVQQQVQEQMQSQTPPDVRKYMQRQYRDPAEMLMQQILEDIIVRCRVQDKFNTGFKHMCLGAVECYHVGIFNGKPDFFPVNRLRLDYDQSEGNEFIEDGDWAVEEIPMTRSKVIAQFADELKPAEIDRIYSFDQAGGMSDPDWTFTDNDNSNDNTLRVLHATWKAPMKLGHLTYRDKVGNIKKMLVDENYKKSKRNGDIDLRWEWIPQVHECYKILNNIYVHCRPVPGQFRDIDNIYECKLPYYGAACDNMNSIPTSPMDRMKYFQYLYDIVVYRIERLMASDKGKKLVANIAAIPKSAGFDLTKFMYFMEANDIIWYDGSEEGATGDASTMFKEIDMSLVSDITKYMNIAEYIETKCGNSIGVTKEIEAQISADTSVGNAQQNIAQASHILRPYFVLHNNIKRNVLNALMETCKVAYSDDDAPEYINYILDDMSRQMVKIDKQLLKASTYGLFVADVAKAQEARNAIINLANSAIQNQQATILDVVRIINSQSVKDAEEILAVAKAEADEMNQAAERMKQQTAQEQMDRQDDLQQRLWAEQEKQITLKAAEDRKTKVQVEAMAALGFDLNKDEDGDGEPDVIEIMKHGLDAEIKRRKADHDAEQLGLEQDKFGETKRMNAHQMAMDKHQKALDKQKLEIDRKKASKPVGKR